MKYSEKIKRRVLQEVARGKNIKDVAEAYEIPISIISNWINESKSKGSVKDEILSGAFVNRKEALIEIKKLIKKGEYSNAKGIGAIFPDDKEIQFLIRKIGMQERKSAKSQEKNISNKTQSKNTEHENNKSYSIEKAVVKEKDNIRKILEDIKDGKELDFRDIEDDKIKFILTCAMAEKNRMVDCALRSIKANIVQGKGSYAGILTQLQEHLIKKNNIFDIAFYLKLINLTRNLEKKTNPSNEVQNSGEGRG